MPIRDREFRAGRADPAERPGDETGERADQREIEHDRRRRLALRQAAGLDHRAGVGQGAGQRIGEAGDGGRARHRDGQFVAGQMRRQHDQHADKADDDRRPAIDAHALLEHERRERHGKQRRGERDGVRFHKRQPRQRAEIAEHADDADRAAAGLAERPLGAHHRGELAAPRIDRHDRDDREGRTVEHHLADRIARAEKAHQRRHHGEQHRRDQLEQNAFAGIHRRIVAPARANREAIHRARMWMASPGLSSGRKR